MNKSELLENYTAGQLAEMVEKLDIASEMSAKQIYNLQFKINDLEEENGRLQAKLDTYNEYLLPRCTEEARELIDGNHFVGVMIVSCGEWNNRGKETMNISKIQKCQEEYEKLLKESPLEGVMNKISKDILEQKNNAMAMEFTRVICDLLRENGVYVHCTETKISENKTHNSIEEKYRIEFDSVDFSEHDKEFTDEIERLKSEVKKYCKAFAGAKKERDCQIAEYRKKIEDLEKDLKTEGEKIQDLAGENMKLQCERNDYKSKAEALEAEKMEVNQISDFLPTEPIKVADMLISAEGEYERHPIAKAICGTDKGAYRIFDVADLRQIAEHLLVYCNHNESEDE